MVLPLKSLPKKKTYRENILLPIEVWLEVFWPGLGAGWVCSDIRLLVLDDVFPIRAFFFLLLFDVSFNMTQPAVTTGVFTVQTPQQLESSPRKVWAYPHRPPPRGDPSWLDPEPSSSSSWFSAHVKPRNDDHRNFRCFSPDFKNALCYQPYLVNHLPWCLGLGSKGFIVRYTWFHHLDSWPPHPTSPPCVPLALPASGVWVFYFGPFFWETNDLLSWQSL